MSQKEYDFLGLCQYNTDREVWQSVGEKFAFFNVLKLILKLSM